MIIFYYISFFTLIYRIFNCTILIVLVTDNNAKNLIGAFISNNVWFVNQLFLWVIFFFNELFIYFQKQSEWFIYNDSFILRARLSVTT